MIAVCTVDGKATVGGTSATLGNEEDTALLHATRAWADGLIVGAATVRAENYGPISSPHLQVIVLSESLDFGDSTLGSSARPPLVVTTTNASPEAVTNVTARGFHVLPVGDLSAGTIIDIAQELGLTRLAVEGGPRIYDMFFQEHLVDEVLLTIDPQIAGGEESLLWLRPLPTSLHLESCRHSADGTVFLHYRTGGVRGD